MSWSERVRPFLEIFKPRTVAEKTEKTEKTEKKNRPVFNAVIHITHKELANTAIPAW